MIYLENKAKLKDPECVYRLDVRVKSIEIKTKHNTFCINKL